MNNKKNLNTTSLWLEVRAQSVKIKHRHNFWSNSVQHLPLVDEMKYYID